MIRLADILATHWPDYVAKFGAAIPDEQHAAVRAIRRCRTPALGGPRKRLRLTRLFAAEDAWQNSASVACPENVGLRRF